MEGLTSLPGLPHHFHRGSVRCPQTPLAQRLIWVAELQEAGWAGDWQI